MVGDDQGRIPWTEVLNVEVAAVDGQFHASLLLEVALLLVQTDV